MHLRPAERRILQALSHGDLVPWTTLCNTATGYYNKDSMLVHLWRLKQKLPGFRYEVTKGVGIKMVNIDRCTYCDGTGVSVVSELARG
jgi:hypothetical protein